jgi:hypothetical protein
MAEQGNGTEYVAGNYEKLAPELVEVAYLYNDFLDAPRDREASLRGSLANETLIKARTKAFNDIAEQQALQTPEETMKQVLETIDAIGMPKDVKNMEEFIALRSRLVEGEFVLSEGALYQLATEDREPFFTFDKNSTGFYSSGVQGEWVALGREYGSEEVVGLPVGIYDKVGAAAIRDEIREWRMNRVDFTLDAVKKNIGILQVFGDTDEIEAVESRVARYAVSRLDRRNYTQSRYVIKQALELMAEVAPEFLQTYIDKRAEEIAGYHEIHQDNLKFYEGLVAYRLSLTHVEDGTDDEREITPVDILDLYKEEYLRGQALVATKVPF